jgi:hypothetical protein
MNLGVVARDDRLRDLLRFDVWDWLGELVGVVLLGLVLAQVAPIWVLFIAGVLTLRPFVGSRFASQRVCCLTTTGKCRYCLESALPLTVGPDP